MRPAQLQTVRQNRQTTHIQDKHDRRPDRPPVVHHGTKVCLRLTVRSNNSNRMTKAKNMTSHRNLKYTELTVCETECWWEKQTALTFDLTPLDSLDCFFMKSGLLFDFMISVTHKKGVPLTRSITNINP